MSVQVHYTTRIAQELGTRSDTVELAPGTSVAKLLDHLRSRHGEPFRRTVFDDADELRPGLIVCVNDEHIVELAGKELAPGDDVLFLSAISGG